MYQLSSPSDQREVQIHVEVKIFFSHIQPDSILVYVSLVMIYELFFFFQILYQLRKFYHVGVIVDLRAGNHECGVVVEVLQFCVFFKSNHIAIVNCILK